MRYRSILMVGIIVSCAGMASGKPELVISAFQDQADVEKWEAGDSGHVRLELAPRVVTEVNKMLKVTLVGGEWPGISLKNPPPDWSPYEVLSFVVWTPSAITISVRIDDDQSIGYASRYNKDGINLVEGRNLVQLPLVDVAGKLNLTRIRRFILFLSRPPAGLVLHFEDVRLGGWQVDEVSFIPYEDRYDVQPRMEIVTPHLAAGRPLVGGPLRAFVLAGVGQGREVVELMQRMDYDCSVMHWDRAWDVNTWGIGDHYGKRGHIRDFNLMQRYLASSMQGPEDFEVLILHTPIGWNRFGLAARAAIVDRVRKGAGLVLVMPFPGESGEWPDDLKGVSPLVDMVSDTMAASGYMLRGGGTRSRSPWRSVSEHPITDGVPLEALPAGMETEEFKAGDGAEVLMETEDGFPVLAVKRFGEGRVAAFAARSASLTPSFPVDGAPTDYRYWEVWYDLVNRAARWAAGRDFVRSDFPELLDPGPEHREAALAVEQWKNEAGEVTDWRMAYKPVRQPFAIEVRTDAFVYAGEPVRGSFEIPDGFAVVDGAEYTVRLQEKAGDGRTRTLIRRKLEPAELGGQTGAASFELPTDRVSRHAVTIALEARRAGEVIAGSAETIVVPDPAWDEYEVALWDGGGLPFLRRVEERRMLDLGITAASTSGFDEEEIRGILRAGMRPTFLGFARGTMVGGQFVPLPYRQWRETGDAKWLIRHPSFSDPDFIKEERERFAKIADTAGAYRPLALIAGDETSYTKYTSDFDFDWHPANIARFRAHLEERFGAVEAMNEALGSNYSVFDEVEPVTGEQARSGVSPGLFNEWRMFNDLVWTDHFRWMGSIFKERYPQARLAVSGTQAQGVFNGIDWARLMEVFEAMCDYGGRYQLLQRSSYRPDYRSMPWGGYGNRGKSVDHQVWDCLLQNGAGMSLFWWYALKNPDLTFSRSAEDYRRVFGEMRSGVGRQFMSARPHRDPVAVLWSPTSQRAAWLREAFDDFVEIESAVLEAMFGAGYRPFFVDERAVAAGALEEQGVKALVLPMTLAVGRGEKRGGLAILPAIERFVKTGGMALATQAAEFDEFLAPSRVMDNLLSLAESEDIPARLAAAGIVPMVSAVGIDGAGLDGMKLAVHRLGSDPAGYLVTPLRAPLGFRQVVGADGVIHSVPDETGGNPVEQVVVDVAAFGDVWAYDLRGGRRLEMDGGKVTVAVPAGEAVPIALLPYLVDRLSVQVGRSEEWLTVEVALGGSSRFVGHVLRLEVERGGEKDALLSRNILTDRSGRASARLPLALEDYGQRFEIKVRDVLTGSEWRGDR